MSGVHGELKYRCDWPGCEYVCRDKRLLKDHSSLHSNDYTVACDWPQCDKMFKTRSTMREHVLIHKGEKRHVCPWPGCQYRCITGTNLKIHIKNVHKKSLTRDKSIIVFLKLQSWFNFVLF